MAARTALLSLGLAAAALAGTATAAPSNVPDTLAQRAIACTACHGPQGRATPLGYVPRIAGKPAGYLTQQLLAFRDGRRQHDGMRRLLAPLSDAFLAELAGHFAGLQLPYPPTPPSRADAATLARGQRLVREGEPARQLTACVGCHGHALTGVAPAVPGLLGLPRDYLVSQLAAWRNGSRQARAPDCMASLSRRLAPGDIVALADYLAAQPLPADTAPATTLPDPVPLRQHCGSSAP